jgi:ribosomal protein L29
LQVRKQTGQVEKPHLIKSIKRDRARLASGVCPKIMEYQ